MKKISSVLALAAAFTLSVGAEAGVYRAYYQNFNLDDAPFGFLSQAAQGDLAKKERETNDYCLLFGGNLDNSRTMHVFWGRDKWEAAEAKDQGKDNYYVSFDFKLNQTNFNKHETNMAIVSSAAERKEPSNWEGYDAKYPDWLFSMNMCNEFKMANGTDTVVYNGLDFIVNKDSSKVVTVNSEQWYNVTLMIDSTTHIVKTKISDMDGLALYESNYQVSDTISVKATGFYASASRYSGLALDNIEVGKYVEGDLPQEPVVKLVAANNNYKAYSVNFGPKETLNYQFEGFDKDDFSGKDEAALNATGSMDYSFVEAAENELWFFNTDYVGTLKVWTSIGAKESSVVELPVQVEPIKLPKPVFAISGVSAGMGKTYTVTIDNSEIPLNPQLLFNYTFTPADGSEVVTESNWASGSSVKIEKAGVLQAQAVYPDMTSSSKVTIVNDQQYDLDHTLDFEHMWKDDAALAAAKFNEIEALSSTTTSGEQNWTARLRVKNNIIVGTDTTTITYPTLRRWDYEFFKDGAAVIDSTTAASVFPNLTLWYTSKNQQYRIYQHVGIIDATTSTNYNTLYITGCGENDFALAYQVNAYGSNYDNGLYFSGATADEAQAAAEASNHGTLSAVVKGNGNFTLYRIDTSVTRIEYLKAGATVDPGKVPEEDAIVNIRYDKAPLDGAIYNLRGMKMDPNKLAPGIYIQNGQRLLVK